ncbi:MAG: 5'/3'-nucleotidase SurE [Chloroflexota bacterium]|nr:5'/3'-nucleotidase SurE [Chloroflexota bacterium]
MTETDQPLILVTNDDGIASPGLRAAVRAVLPLGEVLVVAPAQQQTGSGRSMPPHDGHIQRTTISLEGNECEAFTLNSSPAIAVMYGLLKLAPRPPSLVVSGINYGENVGAGITASGTIGAALEAAASGIPALAVSLETDKEYYYSHSDAVDFSTAAHFTRQFARQMLTASLPPDVDILKVDVPRHATPSTPWHVTRVSRQPYFHSVQLPDQLAVDFEIRIDMETLEPDSDVYVLRVARRVSVAPLSIDLSSRVDPHRLDAILR